MSVTKALGTLNLVSARGLDNGPAGALKLANQARSTQNIPCESQKIFIRVLKNTLVRLKHPFLHRQATDFTRLRRVVRRTWNWKRNRKQQSRAGLSSRRRRWSRRRQPQSGPARRWTQMTLHHNMSFNRSAGTSCAWSKRRISFSGHFFMRRFTFNDEINLKGKFSWSMTKVMANVIHAMKCLT